MGFSNPLVAGGGALVIPAIRSPNYQQGTAGWIIRRDGSAEFVNVTIVGGELLITDPDGSYVRVFDENPGNGAVILLNPADLPGHTLEPARIRTDTGNYAADSGDLFIRSPAVDGGLFAFLALSASPTSTFAEIAADLVEVQTDQLFVYSANQTAGFEVFPDTAPDTTRLAVDGRDLGFNLASDEGINGGAAFSTTSATFVTVTGAPTETFVKEHANTTIALDHTMTMQADASGTGWEIALQLGGTDYRTGRMACIAAAVAGQPMLTGGHRVITGVPAGSYTVTPRVRRYVGAGNVIWAATNSYCSFTVREQREP